MVNSDTLRTAYRKWQSKRSDTLLPFVSCDPNEEFSAILKQNFHSTLAIFEWQEGKASFSIELLLHGKL